MDRDGAVDRGHRRHLRICVSRGQLQHREHAERGPCRGEDGQEMTRIIALGIAAMALWAPGQNDARPAPAGIVFVGSSIFHRWTNLQAQMAPLPIVNLAFDGAVTEDILRLVDSRVLPRRPKVVAYYCGSNDISLGEPAAPIVSRIRQFIDRVTTALPASQVVFVSINRAPDKQDRWDVV